MLQQFEKKQIIHAKTKIRIRKHMKLSIKMYSHTCDTHIRSYIGICNNVHRNANNTTFTIDTIIDTEKLCITIPLYSPYVYEITKL